MSEGKSGHKYLGAYLDYDKDLANLNVEEEAEEDEEEDDNNETVMV